VTFRLSLHQRAGPRVAGTTTAHEDRANLTTAGRHPVTHFWEVFGLHLLLEPIPHRLLAPRMRAEGRPLPKALPNGLRS
jgi:hypothetical protein